MRKQKFELGNEVKEKVEASTTLKAIRENSGIGSRFHSLSGYLDEPMEDMKTEDQFTQAEAHSRE